MLSVLLFVPTAPVELILHRVPQSVRAAVLDTIRALVLLSVLLVKWVSILWDRCPPAHLVLLEHTLLPLPPLIVQAVLRGITPRLVLQFVPVAMLASIHLQALHHAHHVLLGHIRDRLVCRHALIVLLGLTRRLV